MTNIKFRFHETFPPQIIYLAEILKLSSENYCGSKNDISNITGIPTGDSTGKVVPHIRYLSYMGLIQFEMELGKYKLSLTELGKIVFNEDPYIMQDITKLILHYNITRLKEGAPQWSYFFREYPYEYNAKIMFSDIEDQGKKKFAKDIEIGPLKSMYISDDFNIISNLDISKGNRQEVIFNINNPMFEATNLYAYGLLYDWELILPESKEITIDDILNLLKWGKAFGFDYDTMLEVLDEISARGIIKINKQLNPVTIIRNMNSSDLIETLYDDVI